MILFPVGYSYFIFNVLHGLNICCIYVYEDGLNFYPATTFFVLKMSSAFYVCCIYSSALQTRLFMEANNMNPYQTASKGAI